MSVRGPALPALRHQLQLSRSLRPLKRRVPSPTSFTVDEPATVVHAAEEGIWLPVLRPVPSRWLDLTLVADQSSSMVLWRQTIAELQTLIEQLGAFRVVRVATVDGAANPTEPLTFRAGSVTREPAAQIRDAATLIDPAAAGNPGGDRCGRRCLARRAHGGHTAPLRRVDARCGGHADPAAHVDWRRPARGSSQTACPVPWRRERDAAHARHAGGLRATRARSGAGIVRPVARAMGGRRRGAPGWRKSALLAAPLVGRSAVPGIPAAGPGRRCRRQVPLRRVTHRFQARLLPIGNMAKPARDAPRPASHAARVGHVSPRRGIPRRTPPYGAGQHGDHRV